MAETPIVTLVTGPNRGIGRGILSTILARPNNTVIAAVRNPQAPVSQSLNEFPKGEGSSLHIVKIDSAVTTDPAAAVKTLEAAGISHVDIIVANAATGDTAATVLETTPEDLSRTLNINLISVLALFQAFEPLLRKAQTPKFIALSSNLGSISMVPYTPGPWYCYGVTKAALNYTLRRMHAENDWLVTVALQPGWVQTDMGNYAAQCVGMDTPPTTVEDSVAGCIKVIDTASREKYAGEWVSNELETIAW
ncbi:putative aflatoxin biosynthesis ketoreductase nor-1 [Corynespora cassiicola Philippines]|uniref:Putative aflatoxin biosynthesis ketoreductase nor-1 n=1 Tax=Corynespora cassiicola Philippines TaxID=1448308 RepID=A0A2T2P9J1_CORCC|nr:putative aflatoxin biosynthesis ketoreductase nor-1 [Corynespora cassiicola Philippines]